MSLKEEDRQILVQLELEKADKSFRQVEVLQHEGYWNTMANRLYYLFHAVSALLINDHREVGSHKGAAIRFHQYYVKTGLFTDEEVLSIFRWKLCAKSLTTTVSIKLSKQH